MVNLIVQLVMEMIAVDQQDILHIKTSRRAAGTVVRPIMCVGHVAMDVPWSVVVVDGKVTKQNSAQLIDIRTLAKKRGPTSDYPPVEQLMNTYLINTLLINMHLK